jgi:ribonuclease HI
MPKYLIYCDGSTRANGQVGAVGAWAYAILDGDYGALVTADAQAEVGTTNQRMELAAALNALKVVWPMCEVFDDIEICTDSAYLHNCVTQKWYVNWQSNGWKNSKKQPVANQDLWEQLVPYFEMPNIKFTKVKGHADNVWNNYVDDLAQTASARAKENKI